MDQRLLAFRETTGLSKKAFSDKTEIDHGLYGRYEAGKNKPSLETLEKIAKTFPLLNLGWLVAGVGPMKTGDAVAAQVIPADIDPGQVERIKQLERELAREKAWTEKLWEENQHFRELGKSLASPEAADQPHVAPMWIERAA